MVLKRYVSKHMFRKSDLPPEEVEDRWRNSANLSVGDSIAIHNNIDNIINNNITNNNNDTKNDRNNNDNSDVIDENAPPLDQNGIDLINIEPSREIEKVDKPIISNESAYMLLSSSTGLPPITHIQQNRRATGIFSKEKSITVVQSKDDILRSLKWEEMVIIFHKARKAVAHGEDWRDPLWIDFQAFEESDMQKIESFFGVHHLTIEDILNPETREKYEKVFNHSYHQIEIDERRYKEYSNVLEEASLSIILFRNFILTFHDSPLLCVQQVVRMLEYCPDRKIPSSDWVLYALLDGIIDLYTNLVDQISKESESLDDLINILNSMNNQNEIVSRIGAANRRANDLYSGLWSKKEILLALTRDDAPIRRENKIYVQSVYDHILRMNQKLKLARDILSSLSGTYMTKVSLELAVASNEVNLIMRTFAAVSTIFLPLTLISGVFGMNIRIPGQYSDPNGSNLGWFFGIMVFFVVFSGSVLFVFKKKRVI